MNNIKYQIMVNYCANYDYTGYNSLAEVVDDFRDFVKRESWSKFRMQFSADKERPFSRGTFLELENAVFELDFLQECINDFGNFSFADFGAEVSITEINTETGKEFQMLNVFISNTNSFWKSK